MSRLISLALALLLVAPAVAKPKKVARQVVDALVAERYSFVIERLSPDLAEKLPEADLKRAWEAAVELYGRVKRIRKTTVTTAEVAGEKYVVIDIECAGEKSPFRVRVTLNKDEQIAGLFFLPKLLNPGRPRKRK